MNKSTESTVPRHWFTPRTGQTFATNKQMECCESNDLRIYVRVCIRIHKAMLSTVD